MDDINWHDEIRRAKGMWVEHGSRDCCLKYIDLAEQIVSDMALLQGYFAEEHAEVYAAKDALIECLRMAVPQGANKKSHLIFKSEGGEEEVAWIIPKDEVESVLARYAKPIEENE